MLVEKLKKGERYKNQTDKWLRPILAHVLPDYLKKYFRLADYNLSVLGYFRGDVLYQDATLDDAKSLIFIVLDIKGLWFEKTQRYKDEVKGESDFYRFLTELRKSRFAYCDYSSSFNNRKIHICVFNLEGWEQAFENFDKGKYSHCFSESEIAKLKFDNNREILWIARKTEDAKRLFEEKLRQRFGTSQLPDGDIEYEIAPIRKEEWLNEETKRIEEGKEG